MANIKDQSSAEMPGTNNAIQGRVCQSLERLESVGAMVARSTMLTKRDMAACDNWSFPMDDVACDRRVRRSSDRLNRRREKELHFSFAACQWHRVDDHQCHVTQY